MLLELQWRNNSRKNEGMEPKQKQHSVEDVTGDRSKVQCCKQQYCTGICRVRSMNQGKLEVVKQEMTRVNTDIFGINELKWTGMGEFNTDDHYIYYCGQESLRRNNTYPSETVLENCRVRNTSKFIAQIYHHTDTKTRKKNHKKRKLLANIIDEYRCKNPQ